MALQTNVFRDGAWHTQTIDLHAVLRANAATRPSKQLTRKPPQCGILTKTILESPVAHSILPVRLRSAQKIDVAFVGDHYIQISELQRDGQLHHIIRKNDFGARIRNATVVGSLPDVIGSDQGSPSTHIKDEDADFNDISSSMMSDQTQGLSQLPPQLLLLILETGDCVFLALRSGAEGPEIVTTLFRVPSQRFIQPGFHLAVDPSSRYMVLGCARDFFLVYELESIETLNARYAHGQPLRPVRLHRPRTVNGVIHKIEFLYPRPSDPHHIILLLIIIQEGRSRLVTYEWELGDDLAKVFAEEKPGHRLPEEHQMPMLIIPLTVRTAFFAISPGTIAVCKDVLHGPPAFEGFNIEDYESSELHHGLDKPLWTTWTRPHRLSAYTSNRDNIYLAREDGVVIFLDIDSENILGASVKVGNFACNVNTAFASLFDDFTDILILGGDSGPGAIFQVPPRQSPVRLGTISNWSPTVDFVTTDEFATWNQEIGAKGKTMVPWTERSPNNFTKPDKIFATIGRGLKGAIAEYRYGLQASIGLDVDYSSPIKQGWLFPANLTEPDDGLHLLLSMPDRSAILHLPEDFSRADEVDEDALSYDISTRTIAAGRMMDDAIIQITENMIVLIASAQSIRFSLAEIPGLVDAVLVDGSFRDDLIALTTHSGTQFRLHILSTQGMQVRLLHSYDLPGEATSLCLSRINGNHLALVGLWLDGTPQMTLVHCHPGQQGTPRTIVLDPSTTGSDPSMEALTSIVARQETPANVVVVAGTRSGHVLTISLTDQPDHTKVHTDRFDTTPSTVSPGKGSCVFVSCGTSVFMMANYEPKGFKAKHNVWIVDANDPSRPPPFINSITVLEQTLSGNESSVPLLFISDTSILLAELQAQPGPVHRQLPLAATPQKLIYSHYYQCLIIAVKTEGMTALRFLDPDTGEDLSKPTNKHGETVDFIAGMGNVEDRIYGLAEWEYKKDQNTWRFILVTTEQGRLLVISAEKEPALIDGSRGKIRFWTRHRKKYVQPIYSIVGHAEGILFCAGRTIHHEILDDTDRKLKSTKQFDLPSPATSLRVVNGKLLALTNRDSLEVIDFAQDGQPSDMVLAHVDPVTRPSTHLIEVGGRPDGNPDASLVLVCDRDCGIAGLWVPWEQPNRDCEVVFEGELPASVRKFRRGRTRPGWLQARRRPQYGIVPGTLDGGEILGLCIDGSVQQFTLLSTEIWRVLRFIQNIALTSPVLYPFTSTAVNDAYEPEPLADMGVEMQVDGDMLQRCLNKRALEVLINTPFHVIRFKELMDELDDGRLTADFEDGGSVPGRYFELAYEILEYYLEPAL